MIRRLLLFAAPIFVFIVAIDWTYLFFRTVHYVFQERDMIRATELLNGTPIFFGPEMTGGGNLPGPLYYILLAVPLAFSSDWQSAWYFMIAFAAAACVVGWRFLSQRFSPAAGVIWVVLFALSANFGRVLMMFLNVSFIFVFTVAALLSLLWAMVGESELARRRAYYWGAFLSGLAVQLHFSTVTLLIGFGLAQCLAPWLGVERQRIRSLVIGLGWFLLPLLPYFIYQLGGGTWGQARFFAGEATSALPSLMLLVEFALQSSPLQLLGAFAQKCADTIPWMLLPLGLTIWLVPVKATLTEEYGRWLKPLLFLALIAAVPFAYWTFATIGIRYAVVFNITVLLLAALLFHAVSQREHRLKIYTGVTAVCALLAGAHFVLISRDLNEPIMPQDYLRYALTLLAPLALFALADKNVWKKSRIWFAALTVTAALTVVQSEYGRIGYFYSEPRLMPPVGRWIEMWKLVYQATGWSYEEAMRRTYFVNHHLERDGRMTYDSVAKHITPEPVADRPDGFFVTMTEGMAFRSFNLVDVRNWILMQNVPQELKDALKSGEIQLLERYASDFLIVPYTIHKPDKLPRFFHNNGQGYYPSAEDRLLGEVTDESGVKVLDDGRVLFKWNECPSHHAFCDAGVVAKIEQKQIGLKRVSIQVVGSALSQVSPWISPTWTQRWIKPYLEVRCGGKEFRFTIAESVGYSRTYSALPKQVLLWGNNSIVAPLIRDFEFPCAKEPSQLTVGREGAEVETLYEVKRLPGGHLSVHLLNR